ncbi:hypothetical protein BC943DRAFT_349025 [Umbelopsis sp. AD052]|nr:hypothetical protein BC943DRAFT_349025 [Umbelopsis sp. AD052]
MLESLVTTLLNTFLGAYISNLNYNQMKIGIWSGEVKLNNLLLKKEALDKFDLPIDVLRGHLGELTMSIPWSNLKTKPVQVHIKDVYVLAAPRNESNITVEEEERRAQQRKQERLANAELIDNSNSVQRKKPETEATTAQEDAKNDSFMSQLVTKIIDNLQVSIKNVHVRYEDNVSNPGHPFAAGVTLSEVSALSTNGEWEPTFISEMTNTTHKLATLESLSVYWNTDTPLLADHSPEDFSKEFYAMISKPDKEQTDNRYLLKPVSGTGKVIVNKQYGGSTPKFDVNMLFEELGFILDEEQYQDAILTVDLFHTYLKRQQYRALRPALPKTPKTHPREFFKFAQRAVLDHIHEKNYKWSWDHFRTRRDDRKQYISCHVDNALGRATASQKEALKKLEQKLSFEDIRFYRSMAKSKLKRERASINQQAKSQETTAKKAGNWLSSWWGGSSGKPNIDGDEDPEAAEVTEQQRQELFEAIDWNEDKAALAMAVDMPKDTMKALIHVKLKRGSFTLRKSPHSNIQQDLVTLVFDTVTCDIIQYLESMKISAALGDLRLYDGSTKGTLYQKMIGVKNKKQKSKEISIRDQEELEKSFDVGEHRTIESDPFFSVIFEKGPLDGRADNAITVKMHHLEIIYNPEIIKDVMRFFKPPETNMETVNALIEVAGNTLEGLKKQTRAGLEYALESHTTLDLRVDMDAPIIIVPVDVTRKDAWALVVDAGHINVESNLAPKEAIDRVLAKQGMEYSEEDFKELESLVYDKFSIKLTETKVLIAESVDKSRQAIIDPSSAKDAHLIDQIDMDFLCEICIVPKRTQLTKIKISGHLPLVSINFSDKKYKTLMNIIDIIVPSIDDEPSGQESVHELGAVKLEDENTVTTRMDNSKRTSYFGKPVWETPQPELLLFSDTEESDDDDDSVYSTEGYTSHDSSKTPSRRSTRDNDAAQVSNEYKQTNFSLSFQIDRVKATLKEAHSDSTESDILLCDLILENFLLVFTQRMFDMNVDVSLKTLSVIDRMEHGNEFTYLVTSDKISADGNKDEDKKNLVNVQYKKINPKSPEYDNIDQSVEIELSALNIIVTRSSILTLYNFVLSTFTGPTKENEPTTPDLNRRERSESRVSIASSVETKKTVAQSNTSQPPGSGVIKVQVCLESLDLILNDDGIRLATGCLSHGDVSVLVKPTTLSVDVKIGNFVLKDNTNMPAAPNGVMETDHPSTQLLYLEGKELATFRYVTYDKEASRYPGYDQLIFLRMGSLRLNFIESSIHQLMQYGAQFAEMKGVYDAAREAAFSSAQQIQQSAALLHYDIRIRSPTVAFPSTDNKRPLDQMIARLGEISVENKFSESKLEMKEEGSSSITIKENTIRAKVESINLRSEFMAKDENTGEEQKQVLDILKELHLDFNIITINHVHGTLIPDTQVNGAISDIQMNLTERQFKFLIDTSNSITSAFTTGPEDTEELENENTDQLAIQAMQSVGVADGSNARSSQMIKDVAKSEALSKDDTNKQLNEKPWSTLDLNIDFKDIKLEIFQSEGPIKEEDLPKMSLASFSLEHTSFKMCSKSDSSSYMEVQIESIVLRDTRDDAKSEFRDVMNRIRTDGPQLQLRYETSPPNPSSDQTLLVALDTPHIILSVDHIFALQKYFMAPFTVEQTTEAQRYAETQKQKASTDVAKPQTTRNTTQGRGTRATKAQTIDQQTPKGSFYYRINIVDAEIILLANPALPNSEAIILSAEQILVSQQALMTINVSKIGMFLCIMNKKSEASIRFVEDFEISMSMESHTSANNNITSIVIDLTALVLKLSYMDITVISTVVNRALELLGQSNPSPAPESKEDDGDSDDDSIGKISQITAAHAEAPSVMSTSVLRRRMNNEPSIVMSRETLKLNSQGIQVILMEDIHEMPILDMNLKPFTVNVSDWSKALLVDSSFSLYTGFFNVKNSHWEPLIEPWSFNVKVSRALIAESLEIDVFSKRKLEINVEHTFVESMLNYSNALGQSNEQQFEATRGSLKPYRIANRTGYTISVWNSQSRDALDNKQLTQIKNGENLPWAFTDWRKRREMELSTFGNNNIGIRFDNKKWDPLKAITIDRQGEHQYILRPKLNEISHRLVVDIKIIDNVKVVTLRSGLLLENRTLVPLEVAITDSKGNQIHDASVIHPEDDFAVPIHECYDYWFRIRPKVEGYKMSEKAIHWSDLTLSKPPDSIECNYDEVGPPSFRFHVNSIFDKKNPASKRYPFMRVQLSPPIEIENLLPFDITYRVVDKDSGQDFSSELEKSGRSPLHIIDLKHLLLMSIDVHNSAYNTSELVVINSHRRNDIATEQTLILLDSNNRPLRLKLFFSDVPGTPGARRLSIVAPYVIINKTGLSISYKYKPFMQTAKIAAGQGDDDVEQTEAVPIYMFSYPKEDHRNRVQLRLKDSGWSQPISFEAIGSTQEIGMPKVGDKEVYLGIHVTEGQGKFLHTNIITITPRYILKNNLGFDLRFKETGAEDDQFLVNGEKGVVHDLQKSHKSKYLSIRPSGLQSQWSAPFNINHIGTLYVKLESSEDVPVLLAKISILLEDATIFIILSRDNGKWPYMIINDSSVDLSLFQQSESATKDDESSVYNLWTKPKVYQLKSGATMKYSWDFPSMKDKKVVLAIGERTRAVDIKEIGHQVPFRYRKSRRDPGIISIDVVARGPMQILRLSDYDQSSSMFKLKSSAASAMGSTIVDESVRETFEEVDVEHVINYTISVNLHGIGISIINQRLQEMAYVSMKDLQVKVTDSSIYQSLRVSIQWLQIDNQFFGSTFPILLYPTAIPKDDAENAGYPTFHFAIDKVKDTSQGVLYLKYFSVLLQEMTFEIDEDFLFGLMEFSKFNVPGWEKQEPKILGADDMNIPDPKVQEEAEELYFEVLNIQPMRLNLSFVRTERINASPVDERNSGHSPLMFVFNVFTMTIGSVNDAPVKLNALAAENMRVSYNDLIKRMTYHYGEQVVYQIHKVIGSADVIGNPVGLFNTLSSGVAELFYEPYQGVIMSDRPQDLGIGIARGVGGFFKKSVFGFSDSFSKFTGSLGKGLAVATMDRKFQDRRRANMTRNRPKHAMYGVTQGVNQFGTSLASGVVGLVKRPMEGASQEGVGGFVTGMGRGLVGVVTKPVVGMFDLANNVSQGVRNTTTIFDVNSIDRLRLPRYIAGDGILRPYSQREALGQSWLKDLENGKFFNELYIAHCILATNEMAAILTNTRILVINTRKSTLEWQEHFSDIETLQIKQSGILIKPRSARGEPYIPIPELSTAKWFFAKIEDTVAQWGEQQNIES